MACERPAGRVCGTHPWQVLASWRSSRRELGRAGGYRSRLHTSVRRIGRAWPPAVSDPGQKRPNSKRVRSRGGVRAPMVLSAVTNYDIPFLSSGILDTIFHKTYLIVGILGQPPSG